MIFHFKNDPLFIARADEWFSESGDLIVERTRPGIAFERFLYLLTARGQLRQLIADSEPGDWVTVVREKHLPVRGVVDDAFLTLALQTIKTGQPFVVMSAEIYPNVLTELASGAGPRVLENVLQSFWAQTVFLGQTIRIVAFDDLQISDKGRFLYGK